MPAADAESWFTERIALAVIVTASVVLAALVVLPYLQYVLIAVVLAYVLAPVQRAVERRLRPTAAALVVTGLAVVAIVLPTLYLLSVAVQQGIEIVQAVQEGDLGAEAIETQLAEWGIDVDVEATYADYRDPIEGWLQGVASSLIEVAGNLPDVLVGLTVSLFVLFALLRDGERFVAWIAGLLPVGEAASRAFLDELDRLMWASIVGNAAVAALQALALGAGLMVLDLDGVVFLTVVTFVLALLPLVGAFAVWFPLSIYLVLVGRPIAGGGLFAYGLVVSASDNYVRPALIGRTGELNVAIVVLGIFGGVAAFGVVGLFVGPVVLGGAKVALDIFLREPNGLGPGSTDVKEPTVDAEPGQNVEDGPDSDRPADTEAASESTTDDEAPQSTTEE